MGNLDAVARAVQPGKRAKVKLRERPRADLAIVYVKRCAAATISGAPARRCRRTETLA